MSNTSKLPDLKELSDWFCKLGNDLKISLTEILADYKAKHPSNENASSQQEPVNKSEPEEKEAKPAGKQDNPSDQTEASTKDPKGN